MGKKNKRKNRIWYSLAVKLLALLFAASFCLPQTGHSRSTFDGEWQGSFSSPARVLGLSLTISGNSGTLTLEGVVENKSINFNIRNQNISFRIHDESSPVDTVVSVVFSGTLSNDTIQGTWYGTETYESEADYLEGTWIARRIGAPAERDDPDAPEGKEKKVPVKGVRLDRDRVILAQGERVQLEATVEPDNATNQEVTWNSSNPNTANVHAYDGLVTAFNPGTAVITVTTNEGRHRASCAVHVFLPEISGRQKKTNPTYGPYFWVDQFESTQLQINLPAEAANYRISWRSSQPDNATINRDGVVFGRQTGWTQITAEIELDGRVIEAFPARLYVYDDPKRDSPLHDHPYKDVPQTGYEPASPEVPEWYDEDTPWEYEEIRREPSPDQELAEYYTDKALDYLPKKNFYNAYRDYTDGKYVNAAKELLLTPFGPVGTAFDHLVQVVAGDDWAEDLAGLMRQGPTPYPVGPSDVVPREDLHVPEMFPPRQE